LLARRDCRKRMEATGQYSLLGRGGQYGCRQYTTAMDNHLPCAPGAGLRQVFDDRAETVVGHREQR
jgi:hypothetical protein